MLDGAACRAAGQGISGCRPCAARTGRRGASAPGMGAQPRLCGRRPRMRSRGARASRAGRHRRRHRHEACGLVDRAPVRPAPCGAARWRRAQLRGAMEAGPTVDGAAPGIAFAAPAAACWDGPRRLSGRPESPRLRNVSNCGQFGNGSLCRLRRQQRGPGRPGWSGYITAKSHHAICATCGGKPCDPTKRHHPVPIRRPSHRGAGAPARAHLHRRRLRRRRRRPPRPVRRACGSRLRSPRPRLRRMRLRLRPGLAPP